MIQDILDFWFADGPDTFRQAWFQRDDGFDTEIRRRFSALVVPAREGALDDWAATPEGALALFLVLDQFPRNLFRGSPEAFASDAHALRLARRMVIGGRMDLALPPHPARLPLPALRARGGAGRAGPVRGPVRRPARPPGPRQADG
jgi:uncharacterized protein (DUF924 family)